MDSFNMFPLIQAPTWYITDILLSISIFTGAAFLASMAQVDQETERPIACAVIAHLRPISQSNLNIILSVGIWDKAKDKSLRK